MGRMCQPFLLDVVERLTEIVCSSYSLGRARGRTWKERAEQAARPQAAAASSTLSGAASYVSGMAEGLSKTLSAKAAEFGDKK